MLLQDHFRPPLSISHPWKGFHSAWANAITNQLNEVLPEGYYAIPEVPLGDQIEIDVAAWEQTSGSPPTNGSLATVVWAPPRPPLSAQVDFTRVHGVQVHVFQDVGGPQLRAAVELVSPANKDRPRSRLTFAAMCVGYLEHGVSVVIVDTVTTRQADLHAEFVRALEAPDLAWEAKSGLAAVAYRAIARDGTSYIETWPEPLGVGDALPTLPLWIGSDLCLPLPLGASYSAACHALRIGR
jgi:hypothetical protein